LRNVVRTLAYPAQNPRELSTRPKNVRAKGQLKRAHFCIKAKNRIYKFINSLIFDHSLKHWAIFRVDKPRD